LGARGASVGPEAMAALPPAVHAAYAAAFTHAISAVFLVATAIAASGFLLAWLLPERPLRATVAATAGEVGAEMGEAFPMPSDPDALEPLMRGLAALADRDVRRQYIEQVVARAGVGLTPAAAWLLVRLEGEPGLDVAALG